MVSKSSNSIRSNIKILNVEGISIKEIAETILDLMANDVSLEFIPECPRDYKGKEASNDKIKRLLNWEPKVDFQEGMKNTIDWFKSIYDH